MDLQELAYKLKVIVYELENLLITKQEAIEKIDEINNQLNL